MPSFSTNPTTAPAPDTSPAAYLIEDDFQSSTKATVEKLRRISERFVVKNGFGSPGTTAHAKATAAEYRKIARLVGRRHPKDWVATDEEISLFTNNPSYEGL